MVIRQKDGMICHIGGIIPPHTCGINYHISGRISHLSGMISHNNSGMNSHNNSGMNSHIRWD